MLSTYIVSKDIENINLNFETFINIIVGCICYYIFSNIFYEGIVLVK